MKHLISVIGALMIGLPGAAHSQTIELPKDAPRHREVQLTEVWRLGGDEEDVLLGRITGAMIDEQNQVFLVDRQLSQVLVINSDGELVSTLGRPGEGPGELGHPHAVIELADDAIGIIEGFPGRVIGLTRDGVPARDITFGGDVTDGGFNVLRECMRFGDRFIASTGRMVFDQETGKLTRNNTLGVYDSDGALVATIASHTRQSEMTRQVFDEAAEFSEFLQWTATADGLIYTTPVRDEYVITVRDFAGAVQRTIRRPFSPRRRSQAEKDKLTSDLKMVVNGQRLEVENKALAVDQVIRDLASADDGRLFVTNSYQHRSLLPPGTAARYDIISPQGQLLEELSLAMPGFDGTDDALVFLDGTYFLALLNYQAEETDDGEIEVGDEEPLTVVLLRIP